MKDAWIPLGIISAFSYAMVVICDRMGAQHIDSVLLGILQTATSLLLLVAMTFYTSKFETIKTINIHAVPYIVASTVFAAVYYASYYFIMRYASATKAASLEQLSVIFIIYLAVFLGEAISWKSIIGSLFVLLGIGCMMF